MMFNSCFSFNNSVEEEAKTYKTFTSNRPLTTTATAAATSVTLTTTTAKARAKQ